MGAMDLSPAILLVHAADTSWGDLIGELREAELPVQPITSLTEAELRIQNQRPDVVLLDGHFDRGIDLLLHARQTASGMLLVTIRKLRGGGGRYDATLSGDIPIYLEPASARELAGRLKEHLRPPAARNVPR